MKTGSQKLEEFVEQIHKNQKRKYTEEPYINHLRAVRDTVAELQKLPFAEEIALLHDSIEDVEGVTSQTLKYSLISFGYDKEYANYIVQRVEELTNHYTKENYPNLNRGNRKKREAKRLGTIHPVSQTVKVADIMDNIKDIVDLDRNFSVTYLTEKEVQLDNLTGANVELRKKAYNLLQGQKVKLNETSKVARV